MIGERNHRYPTVDVPPWSYTDDRGANRHFMISPSGIVNSSTNFTNYADDYSLFLHHETCPNDGVYDSELEIGEEVFGSVGDIELPVDVYACDSFRMYEFKVRKCARGRSHDWTDCPYAHPGEKARRRDPRKYQYSGTACPDYRKGNCSRGDICEFAHGVFECWLHPTRYRTQPCKDGGNCKRKVCFFAHSPEQLRVISPNSDSHVRALHFLSSPESSSPPTESPPMSPMTANSFNSLSRSLGSSSVNEMMASLRQLQLNRLNSMPSPRNLQVGSSGLGSPRRPATRPGYSSLPVTPTGYLTQHGSRCFDIWEEEPAMERVESGRDLRVKMFQRLSKENPLDGVDPNPSPVVPNPDVGWVSDLIQ